MSKEISICPMEENDADFVLEIRNDETTRAFLHDSRCFTKNEFKEWFKTSRPWWFIVRTNDVRFGYFRTNYIEKQAHSIQIGMDIHPSFRGQGLAKPAYGIFFDVLRSNGFKNIWLEVLSHNSIAEGLYKGLGFVATNKTPYKENIDSIRMELKI